MIKELSSQDSDTIYNIINKAAQVYSGIIPDDCFHQPYMPLEELQREKNMGTI